MRLRKIRLAGFKSFVDPTTLELPGDIVGVVGPNGCGKSNIIDAVRWVMGEVSARSLRGDTMADVVFNGSRSRQPVSRASVELVFDNLDGRAGGRFAAYNEIAVRRQIVRDGQSSYWLNGARCRRRDVMDLFHGTGLGPRSYAIIEQGMIARIIEARPDDLRDFLEEAAGISMYKERRRETENRMRHTVENLDRLNDLRDELVRRLAHLERQAAMAEKFRGLEAERRELEAEHLALQWRGLDEQADRDARRVADRQNRLDAALAGQRRVETDLEKARSAHAEAMEAYNRHYRSVIDAGAEVARAEESIQAMRQRREEISGAIREETERVEAARGQIETERREREALAEQLAREEPALAALRVRSSDARQALDHCENAVLDVQAELEALSDRERDPPGRCTRSRLASSISNRPRRSWRLGRRRSNPSTRGSTRKRWRARPNRSAASSRRWNRSWRRSRWSAHARVKRCRVCARRFESRRERFTMDGKRSGGTGRAPLRSMRCSRRRLASEREGSPTGSKSGVSPTPPASRSRCGLLPVGSMRWRPCSGYVFRRYGPNHSRRSWPMPPPLWSRGR